MGVGVGGRGVGVGGGGGGVLVGLTWGSPMMTGVGVGPLGVGVVGGKEPPGTSRPQARIMNRDAAKKIKDTRFIAGECSLFTR